MRAEDRDSMKKLLQQALPPIQGVPEPSSDLWLAVLGRVNTAAAAELHSGWAWFDGALAVALVALVAVFPASIPLLLYYL